MKKNKLNLLKKFEESNKDCFKDLVSSIQLDKYSFDVQDKGKCLICGDKCYGLEYWIDNLNKKALLFNSSNFKVNFKDFISNSENRNNLSIKLNDFTICNECINKIKEYNKDPLNNIINDIFKYMDVK